MADRRKLQGEIERCLKKVAEGCETFDDIWQKVYNATNTNQKEKYEADLKKEIKKLQRLRDQIKTWLASPDIKDKSPLQEARKNIEMQMERFKVVERETKTKAYSKEGLGAAQKLDPAQKEKDEVNCWLTACIDSLTIQVDKFESEIDSINFSLKKKKNDKEKLDRLEELKVRHGKHKYHINQLEALLRMLDNGTVEVEQIKKIKEDVEYYRDFSEDPDFQENEFIYDDLNLEDLEDYLAKQQTSYQQAQLELKSSSADDDGSFIASTPTSASSNSPSHSPSLGNHSSENSTSLSKAILVPDSNPSKISPKEENSSHVENSVTFEGNVSGLSFVDLLNCQSVINSPPSTTFTVMPPATTNKHFKMSNSHENIWSSSSIVNDELSNSVNTRPFHSQISRTETSGNSSDSSTKTLVNNSWTDSKYSSSNESNFKSSNIEDFNDKNVPSKSENLLQSSNSKNLTSVNCQESKLLQSSVPVSLPSSYGVSENVGTLKNLEEQTVLGSGLSNHIRNLSFTSSLNKDSQTTHTVIPRNNTSDLYPESSGENREIQINLATVFGEIPPHSSPSNEDYIDILEASSKHMPHPADSRKQRCFNNKFQNLVNYPTSVPDYYNIYVSNCNSKEFFQRLSTETLFFIFYFLQGTKAQYFAARALKIKSWRFHTMYMMWFQRHEEPKTITDEYEQGTYIYFDYERWAQRKKEGFTFEYKYLEDRDFN